MSRFLVLQLPDGFPDPLHDTQAFEDACTLVGLAVGESVKGKRQGQVRISYRCAPDPIAVQLAAE